MPPQKTTYPGQYKNALKTIHGWFGRQGWRPFDFQVEVWRHFLAGRSGLVHAPTGIGKTYAVWMGTLIERLTGKPGLATEPRLRRDAADPLKVLWITPLRALAADTRQALVRPLEDLRIPWSVEVRSADTPSALRAKQKKELPTALITTPESLSILLSYPETQNHFRSLELVIVDEWHELLGSKRGVLLELAMAHLRGWRPALKIWGLSATLGNTQTALEALLGRDFRKGVLVRGMTPKTIDIASIIPPEVERFPWAGHLGLTLLPQVLDCIEGSKSVLVFTNTRSQTEIWFQAILAARPDWAGIAALHHGSLDKRQRNIVEESLRRGKLKCVVCTSSLDLGVDFSPVDTVIQIGSPKGIARLMQRAGRSGHQPGQASRAICVPTNALELMEISAARQGVLAGAVEPRQPVEAALDVLAQHLVTIACAEGFVAPDMYTEVKTAYAYRNLRPEEFDWVLEFVTSGGPTLHAYAEYSRVSQTNGRYRVDKDALARRHRMSIGTITSDAAINVRFVNGRRLGSTEESFAARLKRGDTFVFAGHLLQMVAIRDMTLLVKKAGHGKGPVPLWLGGSMPLSTELAAAVRHQLSLVRSGRYPSTEIQALRPLLELQQRWSAIPAQNELLIERVKTRQGYHVFVYAFEGRMVHEGLAALMAYRISRQQPMTLSLAVNDYGLELLSDQEILLERALDNGLLSTANLLEDILGSLNLAEMAKRRFREIARIAGLVFQGYPGRQKSSRQLQASSGLLYNVFQRHDPQNLLLKQATREVLYNQLEHQRLTGCLISLADATVRIVDTKHPTPLAFPILVDRLRARVSTEKLADRIRKLQLRLQKAAERPSEN